MAVTIGAYGTANALTTVNQNVFIPELWSDEIVARYKQELVLANLVRRYPMAGKKGDTVHIPLPTRGQASRKTANNDVRIQQDNNNEVVLVVDQHWEYSFLVEDILEKQAISAMREFYVDDAAYALAIAKDTALVQLGRSANNGSGTAAYNAAFIAGDGNTLYTGANQTPITAAGVRRFIQRMDDNFLPMSGRFMFIPPVARNVLMGIQEFTAQSFTGEVGANNTIRNGRIGDLYNVPVYTSPNADTATGGARIGLFGHKDSLVIAEQIDVRVQTQYKQEKLADLVTADTLFGVVNVRSGADADIGAGIFAMAMPA